MNNNNIYIIPLLLASAVVVMVYLFKKGEQDPSKKPNLLVIFMVSFAVAFGVMYLLGEDSETLNIVMGEIQTGDPDF